MFSKLKLILLPIRSTTVWIAKHFGGSWSVCMHVCAIYDPQPIYGSIHTAFGITHMQSSRFHHTHHQRFERSNSERSPDTFTRFCCDRASAGLAHSAIHWIHFKELIVWRQLNVMPRDWAEAATANNNRNDKYVLQFFALSRWNVCNAYEWNCWANPFVHSLMLSLCRRLFTVVLSHRYCLGQQEPICSALMCVCVRALDSNRV